MIMGDFTAFEVINKAKGEGPRHVGNYGPEKVDGTYYQGKIMDEALPPPPDPQGTNEDAPGFDPEYSENFSRYREDAYNKAGATVEANAIAMWESLIQDTPDHKERDRLKTIRQDVKKRFPKPIVKKAVEPVVEPVVVDTGE
jgi:hypothetical protein